MSVNPKGQILSANQPVAAFLNMFGYSFQVFLDVDPEQHPDGIDVVCAAVGKLEPLPPGKITLPRGTMLIVLPEEMATHARGMFQAELRKAIAAAAAAEQKH